MARNAEASCAWDDAPVSAGAPATATLRAPSSFGTTAIVLGSPTDTTRRILA
jgi:hypothetical protein